MTNTVHTYERCLSEEDLRMLAYKPGQHPQEASLLKHIASCELCADALEGLQLLTEDEFSGSMANLSAQIEERLHTATPTKTKVATLRSWLAVAASLILLMGFAYLINIFLNKPQNELSDSRVPADYKRPEISNSDANKDGNTSTLTPVQNLKDELNEPSTPNEKLQKQKNIEVTVTEEDLLTLQYDVANSDADYSNIPPTNAQGTNASPLVEKPSDIVSKENYPASAPTASNHLDNNSQINVPILEQTKSNKKHKISTKENEAPVVEDDKMESPDFSQGLYSDSLYQVTPEQLLEHAQKLYNQGKYPEAIDVCNKVLDKHTAVSDKSKLIKASCLIKIGNITEAKYLLKKLIDDNSSVKQEALKLLDTL